MKAKQPEIESLRAAAPQMYWALKSALQALPAHRYIKTRRKIVEALTLVKNGPSGPAPKFVA